MVNLVISLNQKWKKQISAHKGPTINCWGSTQNQKLPTPIYIWGKSNRSNLREGFFYQKKNLREGFGEREKNLKSFFFFFRIKGKQKQRHLNREKIYIHIFYKNATRKHCNLYDTNIHHQPDSKPKYQNINLIDRQ